MTNEIAPVGPDTEIAQIESPTISIASQLTRAEIDQQINTARQFPRSLTRVNNNITTLVTMSEKSAEACGYALPRGGKPIVGPSIRFAEIVAQQYGNCRIGARVVHVDRLEKFVEAEGVFHDLETNTATTMRVRRRIVDRMGRLFNDDMIIVTGNAAASIAKRNAILAGVPKALWEAGYDASLAVVKGDLQTLPERLEKLTKAFGSIGVTMDQVCAYLQIDGIRDMNIDRAATAAIILRAIKSGEAQIEDYFSLAGGDAKAAVAGKTSKPQTLGDIAAEGAEKKSTQDKSGAKSSKSDKASKERKPSTTEQDQAGKPDADAGEEQQGGQDEAGTAAESAEAAADSSDGDNGEDEHVDAEAVEAAYGRGQRARSRGQREDGIPPDIKRDPKLSEAWLSGWREGSENADQ